MNDYAKASICAAQYAYEAVDNPVEGTMLTLMREWGKILSEEIRKNTSISDIFNHAFRILEMELDRTKEQLLVLKKANVVDSGAKGFTYFIEGVLHYLVYGEDQDLNKLLVDRFEISINDSSERTHVVSHIDTKDYRYCTECLLESNKIDNETIKTELKQLGNSIYIQMNRQ